MNRRINLGFALGLFLLIFAYFSCFEVSEGTVAINVAHKMYQPGLQVKWPWQKVTTLNINHQEVSLSLPSTNWSVVAHIASPSAYFKNSAGQPVATLIKQAWTTFFSASTVAIVMTPAGLMNMQTLALKALQNDPALDQDGIVIDSVVLTGVNVSDQDAALMTKNMQGLSSQIVANILTAGVTQAQSIRTTAETQFLATQKQALDLSAQITSGSQAAAVKILEPLYQKNPALFKQYMQEKAQLLKNSNS